MEVPIADAEQARLVGPCVVCGNAGEFDREAMGARVAVRRGVFGDVHVLAVRNGDGRGEELADVGEDPARMFPQLQKLLVKLRALEDARGAWIV